MRVKMADLLQDVATQNSPGCMQLAAINLSIGSSKNQVDAVQALLAPLKVPHPLPGFQVLPFSPLKGLLKLSYKLDLLLKLFTRPYPPRCQKHAPSSGRLRAMQLPAVFPPADESNKDMTSSQTDTHRSQGLRTLGCTRAGDTTDWALKATAIGTYGQAPPSTINLSNADDPRETEGIHGRLAYPSSDCQPSTAASHPSSSCISSSGSSVFPREPPSFKAPCFAVDRGESLWALAQNHVTNHKDMASASRDSVCLQAGPTLQLPGQALHLLMSKCKARKRGASGEEREWPTVQSTGSAKLCIGTGSLPLGDTEQGKGGATPPPLLSLASTLTSTSFRCASPDGINGQDEAMEKPAKQFDRLALPGSPASGDEFVAFKRSVAMGVFDVMLPLDTTTLVKPCLKAAPGKPPEESPLMTLAEDEESTKESKTGLHNVEDLGIVRCLPETDVLAQVTPANISSGSASVLAAGSNQQDQQEQQGGSPARGLETDSGLGVQTVTSSEVQSNMGIESYVSLHTGQPQGCSSNGGAPEGKRSSTGSINGVSSVRRSSMERALCMAKRKTVRVGIGSVTATGSRRKLR